MCNLLSTLWIFLKCEPGCKYHRAWLILVDVFISTDSILCGHRCNRYILFFGIILNRCIISWPCCDPWHRLRQCNHWFMGLFEKCNNQTFKYTMDCSSKEWIDTNTNRKIQNYKQINLDKILSTDPASPPSIYISNCGSEMTCVKAIFRLTKMFFSRTVWWYCRYHIRLDQTQWPLHCDWKNLWHFRWGWQIQSCCKRSKFERFVSTEVLFSW